MEICVSLCVLAAMYVRKKEGGEKKQCWNSMYIQPGKILMVWAVQATYIRQQSASKCLNAGSSEVNYLNAARIVVGHRASAAAK